VDITNPVNESFDALVVPPDGSATQELASLAPDARFVKAFNTTFAGTLASGEVSGQPLDVFVAGDDAEAKDAVATIARDGGLNPIDVGGVERARELEALGLLHMQLQEPLGTGFGSAVKILA
jgi:predicted dinucleotide-binding enzyme